MRKPITPTAGRADLTTVAVNTALVIAATGLGVVAFFASLELALLAAASLFLATTANAAQGNYALATVRNLWLIGGGAVTLGAILYALDAFFKRWREAGLRRVYARMVAVEAAVIGAAWVALG